MLVWSRNFGAPFLVLLGLCFVACSAPDDRSEGSAPDRPSTTTEAESVASEEVSSTAVTAPQATSVTHQFGETAIPLEPERIAVLGLHEQDSLIAIGVIPVAVVGPQNSSDAFPPLWSQDSLLDAEILEPVGLDGDIDYSAIADLQPDLIMATKADLSADQYERLSLIAPTVARPSGSNQSQFSWQAHAEFVGKVLGFDAEASQAILVTQAAILDAIRPHPALKGSTFAHLKVDREEVFKIAGGKSASARFFRQLGLAYPSNLDDEIGGADWATLTEDLESLLDVDVLIVDSDSVARTSLVAVRPFLAKDNVVWVDQGSDLQRAVNSITILSLSLILEELVPNISQVVTVVINPPTAEEEAAMEAFRLVYGSETRWEDKAPHLERAIELRDANEAYRLGAIDNNGITLAPKAAQIDNDTATIIYDVYFGSSPAYTDLDRTIYLVDGVWQVTRDDFCGFLSAAQTPCRE